MYVIHGKGPIPLLISVSHSKELTLSQAPLAPSVCIHYLRKIVASLSMHKDINEGFTDNKGFANNPRIAGW